MNWSDVLIDLQMRLGAPEQLRWLVEAITYFIGAFILVNASLVLALLLIWITRKVVSRIQDRIGPNRQGPYGLFQTIADALKLLSKEDIRPESADFAAYALAPIFAVFPVLMSLAVITFGPALIGADLNIGVLYLVALGSIGIMAALMAGWSSNNKYALLSGFRVVAQLLSYEIPMVLAMLTSVLVAGTMRTQQIAEAQSLVYRAYQPWVGLVCLPLAGCLPDLLHLRTGRGGTDAVRPAGGRVGVGRRFPHRVFRHALRHVLPGAIPECLLPWCHCRDALPGRAGRGRSPTRFLSSVSSTSWPRPLRSTWSSNGCAALSRVFALTR